MTQYRDVKKICDELQQAGKPVSLDYLLAKVSGAQASLVVHYQKWRNEQANRRPAVTETAFSEDFVSAFHREMQLQASKQLQQLNEQLAQAIQAEVQAAEHNQQLQKDLEQLQQKRSTDNAQPDLQQLVDQLRASNNLMKEQSAVTANHQAEQRKTIKKLRDELQQQREQMQEMLIDKSQWSTQKQQLEEQVSFVKSNAAATIERLTRYREQAQEKIEKLEQKLHDQQKDPAAKAH